MVRLTAALLMLILSVLVDFTSRILSEAVDGIFIIVGVWLLLPVLIKGIKNK